MLIFEAIKGRRKRIVLKCYLCMGVREKGKRSPTKDVQQFYFLQDKERRLVDGLSLTSFALLSVF